MGKFTGQKVLEHISSASEQQPEADGHLTVERFSRCLEAAGKDNIGKIRDALRILMTENVGIFRNEQGLSQTIEKLKELQDRAAKTALSSKSLRMNQELVQHWELDNLLGLSMIIARAALDRKESRGAHYREDFPARNDAFNYHTLISMTQFGDVELDKREVDMSIFREKGEFYEKFGMIERKY
jgi:succinate dehydrogenase / fumarate reductase flavoprotein subunit